MNTEVMFSSKSEMWSTPQDFFEKLNDEFHFTLDAAASDNNRKCFHYYTKKDDGLSKPWIGVVWCNPPYGREIGKWVKHAYNQSVIAKSTIVMLLPARTDTKWFHDYILGKAEIRFIRGRLKFGGSKNGAPFPSMVVVYRGNEPKKQQMGADA